MAQCPHCAEAVKDEALVCPHCRKRLKPPKWRGTAIAVGVCVVLTLVLVGPGPRLWRELTSDEAEVERVIRARSEEQGMVVERVEMHVSGPGQMTGTLRGTHMGIVPVVRACTAQKTELGFRWSCN